MKNRYIKIGLLALVITASSQVSAQVKVGDNPQTVNADAALEIESTDKGLILPRIALTSTTSAVPMTAHVEGMTVYNTATAGTDDTAVTPGYYYNDGTKWVRIADATDIKTEPWFVQGGTTQATLNTQNIYQTGKVSVGGSNAAGILTVINASGATNTVDLSMRAALSGGGIATLNFVSNLGENSFSSLTRAGDKGLIFSTDGNANAYSQNGLLITPHTAAGGLSPFGFKITEQGLTTINAKTPTETFDVNGTFRVRQLPVNGQTNAIYTLPNGNSSLPATGEFTDISKTQTFTATRTVVADAHGVLGYVNGLPGGNIAADNGLTKTGDNIQLGGTLLDGTTITMEENQMAFEGDHQTTTMSVYSGLLQEGVASSPYDGRGSISVYGADKDGDGNRSALSLQAFADNNVSIFAFEQASELLIGTDKTLAAAPLVFYTSEGGEADGGERARITGTGEMGIGTDSPTEKLDIDNGNVRIRDINSNAGTTTDNIVVADADGVLKTIKAAMPKFFYMPSVVIPTHNTSTGVLLTGTQTINLYDAYTQQFGYTGGTNQVRSNNTSTIPTLAANELDYFITYFDEDVFENVAVSAAGVLTYSIKSGAVVTPKTFMNIVFKVRD